MLKLDVVDSDPVSGSEVLHWVTKFPVSSFKNTWENLKTSTLLFLFGHSPEIEVAIDLI